MASYGKEKQDFFKELKTFVGTLKEKISQNDKWTIRGFIDIFKNIYPVSADTKVVSKILEVHLLPYFLKFAEEKNFKLELPENQNWYPDFTFVSKENSAVKFAVDLKTTYRDEKNKNFCNGFTLGSHGEYFIDRKSKKNVQYPYGEYGGHFCVGIIYSREKLPVANNFQPYNIDDLEKVPPMLRDFIFFAEEKWKIASDTQGSGNTANIGSIKNIDDLINGRGVFSVAGENFFDDYWVNFGRLSIPDGNGKYKKLSSFAEFLNFKELSPNLNYPKKSKKDNNKNG